MSGAVLASGGNSVGAHCGDLWWRIANLKKTAVGLWGKLPTVCENSGLNGAPPLQMAGPLSSPAKMRTIRMMPPSTLPLLRRPATMCRGMKFIGGTRAHRNKCYRFLQSATSNGHATPIRNFVHHISSRNLSTDQRIQQRFSSNTTQPNSSPASTDVLIVGGGIAGICTAHYLLRQSSAITVRLIDELPGVAQATSRINGGLICPSLSNSWTNMPIFTGKDALARMAFRQSIGSGNDPGSASLLLLSLQERGQGIEIGSDVSSFL